MSSAKKPATRSVHVAPEVHAHWHRDGRHRFELGFLVGQSGLLGTDDLVLAAVEVPSEAPDLDHDVEVVQGFEDLTVDWVVEIAKQVNRLLPGGTEIMGLYVVAIADARSTIDQASVYLRAIAAALALPTEFQGDAAASEPEHHCIVHICSKTSAKSVRSFANLRDMKRTAELAAQLDCPSTAERLAMKTMAASVAIDEPISFSQISANASHCNGDDALVEIAEKRIDELQQQLQPLVQRVWRARGVAVSVDQIELLSAADASAATAADAQCRGVVQCVAFVPASEPRAAELATFYLKRDFAKSLLVRLELLLERFADEEAAGDAFVLRDGGLLRLPKRGLMKWRSGATPASNALKLSVLALAEDDDGTVVQDALEILGAGDELPGLDIDEGTKSLRWLEADSESVDAKQKSAPGVAIAPSPAAQASQQKAAVAASGSTSPVFVILPIVLLLLALLLAQHME